jgi:hypothetical protein
MSADGSKLVAAIYNGGIYTSTNFGTIWTSNNAPILIWGAVHGGATAPQNRSFRFAGENILDAAFDHEFCAATKRRFA